MDESMKALLLLNGIGVGNGARWRKFAVSYEPAVVWRGPDEPLKMLGVSENARAKLRARFKDAWAEREYHACAGKGIKIITCTDGDYPRALFDLSDPPLLLYWHGAADKVPACCVTVVGTRRASAYGKKIARLLGAGCAERGIALISGGASGVDGSAHMGACQSGGVTAAVLGTGVDRVYPSANGALFDEIRERGALVSEYPLGTGGEAWRFPRRNRIVAALAQKSVVVEAPERSGAMITARLALELGREVWAIPGRIDEMSAAGSNRLIFDGATPLTGLDDFFGCWGWQTLLADLSRLENKREIRENFSEKESLLLEVLLSVGERTVDNLSQEVKMSAAETMKIIAVLAARGLIYSSGPGRFSAQL